MSNVILQFLIALEFVTFPNSSCCMRFRAVSHFPEPDFTGSPWIQKLHSSLTDFDLLLLWNFYDVLQATLDDSCDCHYTGFGPSTQFLRSGSVWIGFGQFLVRAMAGMTEEDMKEYISGHMDSDLQFVLSDCGVSLENQVAICRQYQTLRKFRAVGDTRPDVRRSCLQDFGIPQDTPENRAQAAAVVSAWETAQEYIAKETELRAEAKVTGQPRQLQTHERQAMVKAVELVYGSLSEVETPSSDYLSLKAEEVETNEPTAAPLDEITSKRDSTTSSMQSSLDSAGHIRITRTKVKAKVPSNTESIVACSRLNAMPGYVCRQDTRRNLGFII